MLISGYVITYVELIQVVLETITGPLAFSEQRGREFGKYFPINFCSQRYLIYNFLIIG